MVDVHRDLPDALSGEKGIEDGEGNDIGDGKGCRRTV